MPSYSRSYRAKRSMARGRRVSRRVPKLSRVTSSAIIAEKQNFDVKPCLYTTYF